MANIRDSKNWGGIGCGIRRGGDCVYISGAGKGRGAYAASKTIRHPSLPGEPGHELYKKYLPHGGGLIFTFEIKGGAKTPCVWLRRSRTKRTRCLYCQGFWSLRIRSLMLEQRSRLRRRFV